MGQRGMGIDMTLFEHEQRAQRDSTDEEVLDITLSQQDPSLQHEAPDNLFLAAGKDGKLDTIYEDKKQAEARKANK